MAIKLTAESGPVFLEFQVYGLLTTDDLTQIVNHLDGHEIQKISVEVASETPAILNPPTLEQMESTQEVAGDAIDPPEQAPDTPPEQPPEEEGKNQQANPTAEAPNQLPRLQSGGDPFAIMRILAHHDDWLRTKEVTDALPTDWDVSEDALGSNLWSLEDRGLVKKRLYKDDNRQNEYRITELGGRALEHAVERTEDLRPI